MVAAEHQVLMVKWISGSGMQMVLTDHLDHQGAKWLTDPSSGASGTTDI
jgi:hypothetical protein